MNKIKRFFNQNRSLIIKIVVITLAIYIGLRLLNFVVKRQNQAERENVSYLNTNVGGTYNRDYEIASGERKDKNVYNVESNIINNFLDYCNAKDVEKAYNLLTDGCKELLYPDLEKFAKEYVEKIFTSKRNYNMQAWNSNIYRIKIMDDLLATGKTGDTDYIEEYFSVSGGKLNIGNYIRSLAMNRQQEKGNVNITLKRLDTYMNYSIITMNILNNRDTSIMLNTADYADNVYLEDDNESKYVALLHELSLDDLVIGAKQEKELTIKFDIPYSKIGDVKRFNIENIIANYEKYNELEESRIIQMSIDL